MVDVGANIGMISLVCARLVGAQGVVDAFEPNPRCIAKIESFIEHNKITNIRIHRMGLGASEGKLILSVPLCNSGEGTVGPISDGDFGFKENVETFEVAIGTGDAAPSDDPKPPAVIKIDVEGFEYQVLRGLKETLREHWPFVLTEMDEALLKRAGNQSSQVFNFMTERGYNAFEPRPKRKRLSWEIQYRKADPASPLTMSSGCLRKALIAVVCASESSGGTLFESALSPVAMRRGRDETK